jgi:glycosyltransferase involved in cell wall biosynthesis
MRDISTNTFRCPDKSEAFTDTPVVLILSTAEDIAGGEIFLLSLIEKIQRWTPVVATPNPELAHRCRTVGVQAVIVRGLRSLRREHPLIALWRLCFWQSAALLKLLWLAVRLRADVIMAASFSAAHFAFALSRFLNRPGLWSHQHPVLKPRDANFRIASWLLAKGGMSAVACSQAVARSLGSSGLHNANVTVITNNVDVSHFQRGLSPSCAQPAAIIGLVAMITPWKGQHLLIEAVRLLRNRGLTEESFICHIVGGIHENRQDDKLYRDALLQRLSELGLSQQVKFLGKQRNMKAVYENLDIVVSCSIEAEPFGIGIVEAMSMECIVVVPNEGGPAEIVCDGRDGFLFMPRSADDLANKLQYVVENLEALDNIRRAARKSVLDRFSSATMAEDYEAFFSQLLSSAGRRARKKETPDHANII